LEGGGGKWGQFRLLGFSFRHCRLGGNHLLRHLLWLLGHRFYTRRSIKVATVVNLVNEFLEHRVLGTHNLLVLAIHNAQQVLSCVDHLLNKWGLVFFWLSLR